MANTSFQFPTRQSCLRDPGFVVEIRIIVEFDVGVVNAATAESVAHPFGRHAGEHDGDDVGESAGQLEHDHHQRDRHSSHAAQRSRGAD